MRSYDVTVWGCTGFTGKLACEYISKTYPDLKWAIAGRTRESLTKLKESLKLKDSVDIILADINDQNSLLEMVSKTTVLLSTAGPYAKIGTPIVRACVAAGTHYCDITGEVPWVRKAIDSYDAEANAKKLKIVNCCGFDCIPCDIGTQMIVEEMHKKGATTVREVRFTAFEVEGGASGGTIHSMLNMFASNSFAALLALSNPYYLNPRDSTTQEQVPPTNDRAQKTAASDKVLGDYDDVNECWTVPYIMQAIDTRIVNRSNALLDYRYGRKFIFTERLRVPNAVIAVACVLVMPLLTTLFLNPVGRAVLSLFLPSPGQGPSQHLLDHGFMRMRLWGRGTDRDGREVLVRGGVTALHGDPGYRQTAKMISETAVCLALDQETLPKTFGVLTPASGLGNVLRERLIKRGMDFYIDQPAAAAAAGDVGDAKTK